VFELNKLDFLKRNSIRAVNPSWFTNGATSCELFSYKTKKRIVVKTNILFENKEFIENPNNFLEKQDKLQNIIK
jgi:hypothetical protein